MELIKNLEWRYATKIFDSSKKVKNEELVQLKEAIRLSVSSYGLQAYKVLVIENSEIREKLREVSWGQPQITDSSQLFVFCNYTGVDENVVADYIKLVANSKGLDVKNLAEFGGMLNGAMSSRSNEQIQNWTAKQTYIALANLLSAAAELKIDACPMEGFDVAKYNEILGLTEKGLSASVIAAVGYRSSEDQHQFDSKVRKSAADLFEVI
ncbi:MAG: NAD(P)H-dependent oxidoreductase [Prolixibacteraceae bacterium]